MAKTIKVMLSSRCNDKFPDANGVTLSSIRKELKKEIEAATLFGEPIFEVWINEMAPPSPAVADAWDTCLSEVRECDILVVLYNGNAGWAKTGGDIGICHAEYMEGLSSTRGRTFVIELPVVASTKPDEVARNKLFSDFFATQAPFRGGTITTVADFKQRVFEAVVEGVTELTRHGARSAAAARFDLGQALNWSRLDFKSRKKAMEDVLVAALKVRPGAKDYKSCISVVLDNAEIAFFSHAVPAALSVAAARELVGRPFQYDHEKIPQFGNAAGPVHLIACHRGATEAQATNLLGFPDATVVTAPFGVYVADNIQKVQFVFLANCRDETHTRHALQRFFEWLIQADEQKNLVARAISRTKIIKAIHNELN